jgi:tRNA(fMet)-specific endonuclease VapC
MVILDTNVLSILEWESPKSQELRAKLRAHGEEAISTTIVSFEEQMRGWMSYIKKKTEMADQINGYRRLLLQLRNYCKAEILPFDERAAVEFQSLKKTARRTATLDLKIAAIVRTNDGTLWTENTNDFQGIPGLKVVDWTKQVNL